MQVVLGANMAKPVRETPVLTGTNAVRFQKILTNNADKKVSKSDYDRAKAAYKNFRVM